MHPDPHGFTGGDLPEFKRSLQSLPCKLFKKIETGALSYSFCESCINLLSKLRKDTTKREL